MIRLSSRTIASAAALAVIGIGTVDALPLTGQTLGASGGFFPITPSSAVVGPAVEFQESFIGLHFDIDFTESGLVTVTWAGPGGLSHGAPDIQTYTDINGTIADITGFTLVSTSLVSGIAQSDLSFTANSLTLSIGTDTSWSQGGFFTGQIAFLQAVPEPATLALLGIAVAGLGFARRRKTVLNYDASVTRAITRARD